MEGNSVFWCQKCTKKYYLNKESLAQITRSSIQKKVPYLNTENNLKTSPQSQTLEKIYKCDVCGFPMKECKNEQQSNIST